MKQHSYAPACLVLLALLNAAPSSQAAMRTAESTVVAPTAHTGSPIATDPLCCATKTRYPAPSRASVPAVPAGWRIVHTQMVTRHGSRGLTRPGPDLGLLAVLRAARQEGALTPLGEALERDVLALARAQAQLGTGRAEIARPGHGNLTTLGIEEMQGLAQRLHQRVAELFRPTADTAPIVEFAWSGVERADQSARAFLAALEQEVARSTGARLQIRPTPGHTRYPENAPRRQPDGIDRFTLYFHKLEPATDRAESRDDPNSAVYTASRNYQSYLGSERLKQRLAQFRARPLVAHITQATLAALFKPAFLERLEAGTLRLDARVEIDLPEVTGTSKRFAANSRMLERPVDPGSVLEALYELAIIAPLFERDLRLDFGAYLSPLARYVLFELDDHENFYEKGPASTEVAPVTYAMAQGLLRDFFAQAEAAAQAANSKTTPRAKFRFSHAEIVLPFILLLGLDRDAYALPEAEEYRYHSHPWRSARAVPMSANIQWDTFVDRSGRAWVRMLHNERWVAFKAACAHARHRKHAAYYSLEGLRRCYAPDKPVSGRPAL
ncbi:MAG: histidine phosphatase family protein [Casimicrobiaceae bacterium]|nr:histidine phosphatase family protein [Casimicrobiaceae bacterium]